MSPIILLLIGMVIVVGSILIFRLHAFLALILGSLIVAALTEKEAVYYHSLQSEAVRVSGVVRDRVTLKASKNQKIISGSIFLLRSNESNGKLEEISRGVLTLLPESKLSEKEKVFQKEQGVRYGEISSAVLPEIKDRIIHHTQINEARSISSRNIAQRVGSGFGSTCLKIGIMIAMAAIVGQCLMRSGAAERIVLGIRNLLGEKNAPVAFIASGFTLGIPVFFETVFYLMMPLGKAMHLKTGRNYLLYILTIIAGGTMAHSLVPPTPGPLFVAYELGVDIGLAIICGTIVGVFTTASGYIWARFISTRIVIPLRESADQTTAQLKAMAERKAEELPGLLCSVLPILIPLFLLAGGTVFSLISAKMEIRPVWMVTIDPLIRVLGNKDIALTIAAAFSIIILARRSESTKESVAQSIQVAIADAGVIVLITCAGGAFGHVLRQTGIAGSIENSLPATESGLMIVGFLICMIVRTAQGSSTVAMITAVGVVAPIAAASVLSYHPVYIAIAIGCGSKPISWMNDSGFWVISKMSGMTESEMLKTNTVMGIIMAVTGLIVCLIGSRVFPMV
ncbi:MAG: GntP family permease [Opitutales bacterium]|nr:GntP family permease [Opitutales bacterium]MDG1326733.1 GntP family permease [Opitutales bacterium]